VSAPRGLLKSFGNAHADQKNSSDLLSPARLGMETRQKAANKPQNGIVSGGVGDWNVSH